VTIRRADRSAVRHRLPAGFGRQVSVRYCANCWSVAASAQGPELMADVRQDADSPFAARLTAMANAESEALCQMIMTKALGGERWAVELVMRNVFARHADGEDALKTLLEEIRERAARGT